MKSKMFPITFALLASILFWAQLHAQTAAPGGSISSPRPASARPIPFHGTVSAVDQKNKTFTITGKETRLFRVTEKTRILKGASNATMNDMVENQEVSGAYWKNADDSLEAKMVKLGPIQKKSADQPTAAKP